MFLSLRFHSRLFTLVHRFAVSPQKVFHVECEDFDATLIDSQRRDQTVNLLYAGTVTLGIGAILSIVLPVNRLRVGVNLVAQFLACALVLIAVLPVLFGGEVLVSTLAWSYPVEQIDFEINSVSAFFLSFSLPMTFLGSIYAVGYMKNDIASKRHVGVHFALLAMVQISYLIIYSVQNSFAFLVGWEIAALSAWLLVIWDHRNQKIRFAGFNYLISTHLSLLFLVSAFTVVHGVTNSFQFADFVPFFQKPSIQRSIAFVLFLTSFGLKSAFFPFHTWLPRAHSAAPAHVSALMSGVIHKAGLFGVVKIILMMGEPELWMGWTLLAVSSVSAFMGILYTLVQRDIKRLLGYSSTENVGIVGIGLGLGCLGLTLHQPTMAALGFGGGLLHILNHALFKCLLFYGAGSIYRFTHTIDLEKMGGLLKVMKWTGPLFLLGSLASAALPPFNAFLSEFLIYAGLLQSTPELKIGQMVLPLFAALLAFVGGLSAMSITRAFGLMFLGVPRDPDFAGDHSKENVWMIVPMVLHLIGIVIVGLTPMWALRLVQAPAGMMLGDKNITTEKWLGLMPTSMLQSVTFVVLAFVAVLVVLFVARFMLLPKSNRRHVTWGCGYTLPNARMQYSGSSFSFPMVAVFRDILKFWTKEDLPKGVFPKDGSYSTNCVDSVEHSTFQLLNRGERIIQKGLSRIPESMGFSFGIGFVGLIVLVTLVLSK